LIRALLLCGGAAVRFGGAKLLASLPDDPVPIGVRAARSLVEGAGNALAVVRPRDDALAVALREAGCEVLVSPDAVRGLGASLAAGVRESGAAAGWLVALGDMPLIRPATHRAVAGAIGRGARLAAAVDGTGRRGHPVAFSRALYPELAALDGDEGARGVVLRHAANLEAVPVDDAGIFLDFDTPGDIERASLTRR
jgi:molybdenum cofactor cytidylyltransferase